MQLGDILKDFTLDLAMSSVEISQVDTDSRQCVPGSLFFALAGTSSNGEQYAQQAVANGAVCVVASRVLVVPVPVVTVPASRLRALSAYASATIVRHPELRARLVGVTGTNGKTTVTTMVGALARALAWNGANIGTLTNERTTPAGPELYRTLAHLVESFEPNRENSVIALEVSSHALVQGRIEGLRFAVAAFTNLGHDHLDYHSTMDEYFEAKSQLFTDQYAQRAVIWTDDPYGARLAASTVLPATAVGRADASDVTSSISGISFFWRGHLVNSTVVGDFNVDNALMAMTIMSVLGADDGAIAAAMGEVPGVPGRFDVLRRHGLNVVVDYAHTPEGLRRLLLDVRSIAPRARIITVFGCGGERDRAKRPEMGAIAAQLSDLTIVTSDNPRGEAPDVIIDAIMSGFPPHAAVLRQSDRRLAIAHAIEVAQSGDVVVIAGKGHESTQIVGDLVLPFDDRVVAQELLQ